MVELFHVQMIVIKDTKQKWWYDKTDADWQVDYNGQRVMSGSMGQTLFTGIIAHD